MNVATFLVSVPGCVAHRRPSPAGAARALPTRGDWSSRAARAGDGCSARRGWATCCAAPTLHPSPEDCGTQRDAPRSPAGFRGSRRRTASAQLLAALALLLACAPAHAQAGPAGRDRLRIIADHEQRSLETGAVATVSGTAAPPAEDTTLPLVVYTARVLLSALPRTRQCPRSAPQPDAPHSTYFYVYKTYFSQVLIIPPASDVAHGLRLCGYLTARRRTPSGIRTVTVARDSTTVTGRVEQDSSDEPAWAYRVLAWIIAVALFIGLIVGLIVGLIRLVIWWIHDTPAARKARRAATARRLWRRSPAPPPAPPAPSYAAPASPPPPAPPAPSYAVPASPPPPAPPAPSDAVPASPPPPQSAPIPAPPQPAPAQAARRRRRAKPRDVILDAVDAVADTYRDRLQNILEHQDGAAWLDAVNHRRRVSMTGDGKSPPRPYDFLEPRAVLNCLAYDPAGLHLIPEAATTKARQLSGLVNDAVHPRPHAPLTEADGYRAWQLYTDITGIVAVGDPFER